MLRLDEITAQKLLQLVEQVRSSQTEILRQLVAQAKEDRPTFPTEHAISSRPLVSIVASAVPMH